MMDSSKWVAGGLLTGLFMTLAVQAGIYKWTDENGQVHFGDRPGGEHSEPVQVRPGPADSPPATGQAERKQLRQRMLDVYREEREEKRAAAAKARQQRAERKEKCVVARGRLDEYRSASGIYDYMEDGSRRYLDKQQRVRFMDELNADVKRWCGK